MVKFVDYLFLRIYHILLHLKKDEGEVKWSAFLYTGLYVTATLIAFLCLLGVLHHDNYVSTLFKMNSTAFGMITGVIVALLLNLRFYRYTSIAIIEKSYNAMNNNMRRLVDILVYVAMISIPVLAFILFRLYVIGYL